MSFKLRQIAATAGLAIITFTAPAHAFDGWKLENSTAIPGKNGAYDYVSLDAGTNHLFIGRRGLGLQVYDIGTGKVIKTIGNTAANSSNGATVIPEFDLGLSFNENGTLSPFKLSTLEAMPDIKLGEELDSAHYDAATKRVIVNMGSEADGPELIVLQLPSMQKVGSIKVSTKKPEHA